MIRMWKRVFVAVLAVSAFVISVFYVAPISGLRLSIPSAMSVDVPERSVRLFPYPEA